MKVLLKFATMIVLQIALKFDHVSAFKIHATGITKKEVI